MQQVQSELDWIKLVSFGLGRVGLGWVRLGWVRLGWVGLGCIRLGWAELSSDGDNRWDALIK